MLFDGEDKKDAHIYNPTMRCKTCGAYVRRYAGAIFCLSCKSMDVENVSCFHCKKYAKTCPAEKDSGSSCKFWEAKENG